MKSTKTQKSMNLLSKELSNRIQTDQLSPKKLQSLSKHFNFESRKEIRHNKTKSSSKTISLAKNTTKNYKKKPIATLKQKSSSKKKKSSKISSKFNPCSKKELKRQEKIAEIKKILRNILNSDKKPSKKIAKQTQPSRKNDLFEEENVYDQLKNISCKESQLANQFREFLSQKHRELENKHAENNPVHSSLNDHYCLTRKYQKAIEPFNATKQKTPTEIDHKSQEISINDSEEYTREKTEEYTRKTPEEYARENPKEFCMNVSEQHSRKKLEEHFRNKSEEYSRNKSEEYFRNNTQECYKYNSEEYSRDNIKEYSRNNSEEYSRDDIKEYSRMITEEYSRDNIKEYSRNNSEEHSRDNIKEYSRNNSEEYSRDNIKECSRMITEEFDMNTSEESPLNNTEESHEYSEESMMNIYGFHAPNIWSLQEIDSTEEEPSTVMLDPDTIIRDEIENCLKLLPFTLRRQKVDTSFTFIYLMTDGLSNIIQYEEDDFIKKFEKPNSSSQLLQDIKESPSFDFEMLLDPIILDLFQSKFNRQDNYQKEKYILMIFDCMNEALNFIKPKPKLPWSSNSVVKRQSKSVEQVIGDLQQTLYDWWSLKLGKIGSNIIQHESVKKMIELEDWNNCEQEELQIVSEVSDLVFYDLINEMSFLFD